MSNQDQNKTCNGCGKSIPKVLWKCDCGTIQDKGTLQPPTQNHDKTTKLLAEMISKPRKLSNLKIGAIIFNNTAQIAYNMTPVENVTTITLTPDGYTNGEDALIEAEKLLFYSGQTYDRMGIIFVSDGAMTRSNTSGDHTLAVINQADKIKKQGAKIGTILLDDGSHDEETLQSMASTASLYMNVEPDKLLEAMLFMSKTMTKTASDPSQKTPGKKTGLVFCLDSSGSISEGNKKEKCEEAFAKCIEQLKKWTIDKTE